MGSSSFYASNSIISLANLSCGVLHNHTAHQVLDQQIKSMFAQVLHGQLQTKRQVLELLKYVIHVSVILQ